MLPSKDKSKKEPKNNRLCLKKILQHMASLSQWWLTAHPVEYLKSSLTRSGEFSCEVLTFHYFLTFERIINLTRSRTGILFLASVTLRLL